MDKKSGVVKLVRVKCRVCRKRYGSVTLVSMCKVCWEKEFDDLFKTD